MPTQKTQSIRHSFAGGWSTEFGAVATASMDQGGGVAIPFLSDARNVFYELDGSPHKIGGTARLNASAVDGGDSDIIRGVFDFWRLGSTGVPSQKRVIHVGTKIFKEDADGVFDVLKTGIPDDSIPDYTPFEDQLIMATDATFDVPQIWDGVAATSSDLAGSPPNFAFSVVHKNRVWAAGVASNPSRLYFSALLDPEDWTSTGNSGSGFIDIDPNDSDRITALASHKNEVWVFKGPHKGSIHRIAGSSPNGVIQGVADVSGPDAFTRATFIRGIGAVNNNTIFRFRDDLGFMWIDGTIHSLNATASFGDFFQASLSSDINSFLQKEVAHSKLKGAWAVTNQIRGYTLFTVPTGENQAQANSRILMMDFRREQVRWSYWDLINASCLAIVLEGSLPIVMAGTEDGYVVRLDQEDRTIAGAAGYRANIRTPYLGYGSPIQLKVLRGFSVSQVPSGADEIPSAGNYLMNLIWRRDTQAEDSASASQWNGHVLGPSTGRDIFLLDDPVLGLLYDDHSLDLQLEDVYGEFRIIQFEMWNAGDLEDLEIRNFTAQVSISTDSMEN